MSEDLVGQYSDGSVMKLDDLKSEVYFVTFGDWPTEIHISRKQDNPTTFAAQGWCGVGGEFFVKNLEDGLKYGSLCMECFNI
ncbi:MAG: hypothetical protein UW35_C0010G0036 [Candidatus Collierbacteria bacterium GW2011_GWF2_44_15]|nr:MAG: hypothetical protein UW23_C0008G0005 [Candidatus Collierbacteria bacterium GW2011_GWA1_44_12]KKT46679.1 MAG: hypothetical protein UW35_C0010G0036 [Candidatus Collierbacteria bacterium GW2011_GWF2_44_15]